jgi:hypothetical protein
MTEQTLISSYTVLSYNYERSIKNNGAKYLTYENLSYHQSYLSLMPHDRRS